MIKGDLNGRVFTCLYHVYVYSYPKKSLIHWANPSSPWMRMLPSLVFLDHHVNHIHVFALQESCHGGKLDYTILLFFFFKMVSPKTTQVISNC